MDLIRQFVDLFLHIDVHLKTVIDQFGAWTYLILFTVVFCETGLVVTPFLPGDSLLFAAGSFGALAALDVRAVIAVLCAAAILGDNCNYWIGRFVGPKVFTRDDVWYLNKKHLERTRRFFERHGGKAVIIARFAPILRTFSPFVAGIGRMHYPRFLAFSVGGTLLWVNTFVLGGFYFGGLPIVKENFTMVILAIIVISLIPAVVGAVRAKLEERSAPAA
jgi:membrane-associated protein